MNDLQKDATSFLTVLGQGKIHDLVVPHSNHVCCAKSHTVKRFKELKHDIHEICGDIENHIATMPFLQLSHDIYPVHHINLKNVCPASIKHF